MAQLLLYVDSRRGQDAHTGRQPTQALKTLTQALRQSRGDTLIRLTAGRYDATSGERFPLMIPTDCEVRGEWSGDRPMTLIEGGGTFQHPLLGLPSVTCGVADGARLNSVIIANAQRQGIGLWLADGHPQLQRVFVRQCDQYGIVVLDRALPWLQDCQLEDCGQAGITFFTQSKGQLERVQAVRNRIGIWLRDASAPLIRSCRVERCDTGIAIADTAHPVLRDNHLRQNQSYGLHLTGLGTADFGQAADPGRNIVRDNDQFDVYNVTQRSLTSCGNDVIPQRLQGGVALMASTLPDASAIPPSLLARQSDFPDGEPETPPSPEIEDPQTGGPVGSQRFPDMANHWAGPFVDGLVAAGAIAGLPDGTFRPDRSVTRAEFAAFIAASFPDRPQRRSARRFNDVSSNFWAYGALTYAYTTGFLSGFPDGTVRPDTFITRTQALVAVTNGLNFSGGRVDDIGIYRDRAQIPSYAVDSLATATRQRLVVNYPDPLSLRPVEAMTRGELSALIYQGQVALGLATQIPSPYIVRPDTTQPTFSDIDNHWAAEFIHGLASLNLVSGRSDGRFDPDGPITRAQFATLIVNAFAPATIRPNIQFIDVPPDFWAADAIQNTYRGGFMGGFPDRTFAPSHPLLRVQIWIALVNGLYATSPVSTPEVLAQFADSDQVPQYAQRQTAIALTKQFITAVPNNQRLRPNQVATRAETSVAIYQVLVDQQRVPPIQSDYLLPFHANEV
ncbi:S-layer homology domain-containing protein [Halomicronema sp. CCY15110]|uniref:S-layer homology domain-containing protein n=1 Tax=Halomicronema sp. CCY15110 TaxID=2767773 RepID=UPI001951DCD7|nr:S-layer homology domain-containing protein [Halomicronema sp. CCY15110]